MFKTYYQLAKPGIVYGNALTAIGGFFFASQGSFDIGLFLSMLVGISLVIASACVFNNYIDRGIDHKMARTKKRALITGQISGQNALMYATVLGGIGVLLLAFYTNLLTLAIALLGFFVYVIVYGYAKRHSVYGTEIGSVAGAVPVVVGYTAVTNNFDIGALLLFLILVIWQMPHFYAIAVYRSDDYKAAAIPVLPIVKGVKITKVRIVTYIVSFIIVTAMLAILGHAGYVYFTVMMAVGLVWLYLSIGGFKTDDDNAWARTLFRFSLLVLLLFSLMISLDTFLR